MKNTTQPLAPSYGCGDILREDTNSESVPNGWTLCYIDSKRDSRYKRTLCRDLIKIFLGFLHTKNF